MLQASEGFVNAISTTNRIYNVVVTITRNNSGSQPIDISDRVVSYSTNQDFDSRSGRLEIEIDNYDYQLSPLNRESSFNNKSGIYDPLLDANHKIELFEGVLVGNAFEYVKKFEGYLGDDIRAGSSATISISCRDKSKLMQDTYIYQGPSYSLMLVEDVIQDMINEFLPDENINISVLNSTQYMIGRPDGPYTAKDTNLWDACQLLADSASHELRFLEDGSLILRKIERDFYDKTPQLSLNLSNLISDDMEISDADVRNHIVVKVQGFDPITKEDAESIAKYGRKYMEVQRSMSDIITDVSQAHELAEGILRDLRFAHPSENAEIPLHPLIQVGDIVEIDNKMLGTSPDTDIFKVINILNSYSADKKRTMLVLQGYDKFITEESIATNPPTSLSYIMQTRRIQNYPNSGWSGYEKKVYFPMLKWIPPTHDIENNQLEKNFGGYIIERKESNVGNFLAIASIPSYISSLDINVNYFYDYTCGVVIDKRVKSDPSTTSVSFTYRITAINQRGTKSQKSTELTISVPANKIFDINGNAV